MNDTFLTINFTTKNVSLDGKAITVERLMNGNIYADFNDERQEWKIKTDFKLYGHYGIEIIVKAMPIGIKFFIMIWADEGHLVNSKIVKRLKSKYGLKLKIDHNSKVSILDTAWKTAYLEYDIRYSGITLLLES